MFSSTLLGIDSSHFHRKRYDLGSWILFTCCIIFATISGRCVDNCNSHGLCDKYARCACNDGYVGADCSLKDCPYGLAWSDQPKADDNAHQLALCSNRGLCDYSTGECRCLDGFTGHACERLECPNDCNGNGKCMTMTDRAKYYRDGDSNSYSYTDVWDGPKIMGCICDSEYTGYDCSLRVCPSGDDPLTTDQVNERQLLRCIATKGSFFLYYNGYPSSSISHVSTAEAVAKALKSIPSLHAGINVTFSISSGHVCQEAANVVMIEFEKQFGSQSPLVAAPDVTMKNSGGYIQISADGLTAFTDSKGTSLMSIKGSKENDLCSYRGICDAVDGVCNCFDTNGDVYGSSDGYGSAGTRGDCGYVTSSTDTAVSTCPGEIQCSGHGSCSTETYRCDCYDGWTASGDCSERTCPYGLSWFDYPEQNNVAHTHYSECADMGKCNRETGECNCREGFFGRACEMMTCNGPLEDAGSVLNQCNGHGRCMAMMELATWTKKNGELTNITYGSDPNNAHTWDAKRIHGCLCDEGYSSFDCSRRLCPYGDDPGTYDDDVEVQLFRCVADEGNFTISFRDEESIVLSYNAIAEDVRKALIDLSTIQSSNLRVYFTLDYSISVLNESLSQSTASLPVNAIYSDKNGTIANPIYQSTQQSRMSSVCNASSDTQLVIIKFKGLHGKLPKLRSDTSNLFLSSTGENGYINHYAHGETAYATTADSNQTYPFTSVTGTTENALCNNRGLCDYDTGICSCFTGWSSSDGAGQAGSVGDCGYRLQ